MHSAVDVLICSHNDAPHIPGLLESLRTQSVSSEGLRVIFVDNGSTDDTRRVVQENARELDVQYVDESRLGLNIARNTGYRHAQAPYVAHIDADVKVAPDWLENVLRVIQQIQPDLFGGYYLPYYAFPKPKWFMDRYNSNFQGDVPRYLEESEYLSGTTMIWRRSVVEHLGGFGAAIGLKGRGLERGDETNLMVRARLEISGFRIYYDPRIVVYHLTRPGMMSAWHMCKRAFVVGTQSPTVWDQEALEVMAALRLGLRQAITVLTKLVWSIHFRDRCRYPYRENYIYEVVSGRFVHLGLAWKSIETRVKARRVRS